MNAIQFAKYILELEEKGEINEESDVFLDIEGQEDYAKVVFTDIDKDIVIQTIDNPSAHAIANNIKRF